jgi:hypothetical protein
VTSDDVIHGLLTRSSALFVGDTAAHSMGWLDHPERYMGDWLDETATSLPRRHERTLLLGMGGSSSPARLFADARSAGTLTVLDTSNPDSVADTDFSNVNVVASSKSGTTIETRSLLAHALAHGLAPEDLVVITDPGTVLEQLGHHLEASVHLGDPDTGGRFSSLSPFGLIPALYAGWTVGELREELAASSVDHDLIVKAINHADGLAQSLHEGLAFFALGADPITSGGALWLEQLVAETTGKDGRGFIPWLEGRAQDYRPGDMMYWHLVAALLARHLDVDPFNQPDVEIAKKEVFTQLAGDAAWSDRTLDINAVHAALRTSTYNVLQVYAPLTLTQSLGELRVRVEADFGATTANLGPRYLHSTGQLHKGGPDGVVAIQIVQRPTSSPIVVDGQRYTFHDLHLAQALSDERAMRAANRQVFSMVVDDLDEATRRLGLAS